MTQHRSPMRNNRTGSLRTKPTYRASIEWRCAFADNPDPMREAAHGDSSLCGEGTADNLIRQRDIKFVVAVNIEWV
jgi:hypothetical protein